MNPSDGKFRIGDLRQRIAIETPQRVSDGGGGADETWVLVANVWASLRPLSGNERLEADAVAGTVSHEVVMRYRDGLGGEQRLRLGDRLFDLRAVMDVDERHRYLRCLVEERDL
ncbi:MAG: phage head closure protein [Alphaproteobacteria bacterium]|nr:phage head closure protein [Alphaproteobacteria bacterium]